MGDDAEVATALPTLIPHGATARRLTWAHLPPRVRAIVERHCGSAVVSAESRDSGFTPGFASVLTCADGSRHFVKAASTTAQSMFADAYREEARKLAALPSGIPAPRLRWVHDDRDAPGGWVVLGIEYVDARAPHRPWRLDELDACLDLCEVIADRLTPAPAGLSLEPFDEDVAHWPGYWDDVPRSRPDWSPGHIAEAAALARLSLTVMSGSTLVHTDVRDDNLLLRPDGTAWICDWNWPTLGPDWLDSLVLMIGPRGDGLDVDALLAGRRLTRDVPAEHLDAVLALITGYFVYSADLPVPPTSPHIRDAQRWQEQVCWAWLAERRGWVRPPSR